MTKSGKGRKGKDDKVSGRERWGGRIIGRGGGRKVVRKVGGGGKRDGGKGDWKKVGGMKG